MIYETGRGESLEGGMFVCIDCCLYAVLYMQSHRFVILVSQFISFDIFNLPADIT